MDGVFTKDMKIEILRYILKCNRGNDDKATIITNYDYVGKKIFELVTLCSGDYVLVDLTEVLYNNFTNTFTNTRDVLMSVDDIDIVKTIEVNKDIIDLYSRNIKLI